MKRMKLVLAVAAVMAMLVASAVPAMAKGNGGGHDGGRGSGGHMATAHNAGGHNTSGHAGSAPRGEAREGVFDADFGMVNGDGFALPALTNYLKTLVVGYDLR